MLKIAASILDCKSRIEGTLELNKTNINFIHVDVMDGEFVPNVEFGDVKEINGINLVTKYPMDVHLMVDNPGDYIQWLGDMNIEYVTIHLEIDKDKRELFKKIKDLGYKVGLSIKPNTKIKDIKPYLDEVDLVLVMSVEPGLGGQKFMDNTVERIRELKDLIADCGRDILIEVDGGVNDETITKIKDVDIAVVGSYITKSDNYSERIDELLDKCRLNNFAKIEEKVDKSELKTIEIVNKQKLYSWLLVIGNLPFVLLLIISIWFSVVGGSSFGSTVYGYDAFVLSVMECIINYWPVLLVGLILIVVSVINLWCLGKFFKK